VSASASGTVSILSQVLSPWQLLLPRIGLASTSLETSNNSEALAALGVLGISALLYCGIYVVLLCSFYALLYSLGVVQMLLKF
jgi:hypothetical protein